MRDEGITTDPSLSLADQAVNYVLRRVQLDADLRWHMVGTEAYHRLCVADAARRGRDVDVVKDQWATPPDRLKGEKARLPEAEKKIRDLEYKLDVYREGLNPAVVDDPASDKIGEALDLCPRCAGLPHLSINRCPMCRKLGEAL